MSRLPIRVRVAAAFAVAMALVLFATGWFLYSRLGSHLSASLDQNLRLRAQDLAALVGQPGASLRPAGRLGLIESGESYAQLLDGRGRVVDATPALERTPLLAPAEVRDARSGTIYANRPAVPGLDEPSRLLATPIARDGRRLVLVVGATREDRAETLVSLRYELLVAGPIALALATLAGYALAGLSLRAVESMRRRAETISAENPGERLPVPRTGDELARLAETLNAVLARLEAALQRERDFVADAGHELRTPLALLRTELELALRHSESAEELREAIVRSAQEVYRLARLADDLLLIARSDRGELPLRLEMLDVDDLLATIARRFEWRAHEEGRHVTVEAQRAGKHVRADRVRVEQALGNLVDNALRHGGGEVRLRTRTLDGALELHVNDTGEGFPPGYLDRAFERFARPDGGRAAGGAGLGLSIVRVIAEAHGGSAHARDAAEGADVWIVLPTGERRG